MFLFTFSMWFRLCNLIFALKCLILILLFFDNILFCLKWIKVYLESKSEHFIRISLLKILKTEVVKLIQSALLVLENPVLMLQNCKQLLKNLKSLYLVIRIFILEILWELFSELACPKCFNDGLILHEDSRYGLCSNFCLNKCVNCNFIKAFSTCKKTVNAPEVNTRFVYGMCQIGKGFSAAFKLCATFNLSGLSAAAFKNHEKITFESCIRGSREFNDKSC